MIGDRTTVATRRPGVRRPAASPGSPAGDSPGGGPDDGGPDSGRPDSAAPNGGSPNGGGRDGGGPDGAVWPGWFRSVSAGATWFRPQRWRSVRWPERWRPVWWRRGAAVATVGTAIAVPWLFDGYGTALLARTLSLALVAVSVALLTGVAGLPTLGQTGPFAAGAYACAVLGQHTDPVGPVQLAAGATAGALFAVCSTPLLVHARGVVFLMISLAVGELAVIVAGRWRSVTGGTDGVAGLPAVRPLWGLPPLDSDRGRYLYALAVAGLLVVVAMALLRRPAGLLLLACRDDEARMRASGHRVAAYLCVALVAAGAIAGVGGSLLVTTEQYVSPSDFGFDVSTLLLLGVVIGGTASVPGAVAGTVLVVAARDWLSDLLPGQAPLLLGAVFVVTAYLRVLAGRRARP